jgi:hypothetical protein
MFKTIKCGETCQTGMITGPGKINVQHETIRHFRNLKREYLKEKINEI